MWCGSPPFSVCSSESNAIHTDDYKVKSIARQRTSVPTRAMPNLFEHCRVQPLEDEVKAPLLYRSQRHRSESTIIANGADATTTYDTACPADSPTTEVDDDVRHSWSGSPLPIPTYVPRQGAVKNSLDLHRQREHDSIISMLSL